MIIFFYQASKKKVYMLFNLEPDQSVTGGSWYSDQDFESEFVDVLNQQCFKFLQQKVRQSNVLRLQPSTRVFLIFLAVTLSVSAVKQFFQLAWCGHT